MSLQSERTLRQALSDYVRPSTHRALIIFSIDLILYLLCTVLAVLSPFLLAKIIFSLGAGFMISQLFVVGHDAAHGSFTPCKRLNKIVARVALLPALHNYRLWLLAHNKDHHRFPNLRGINSWSPKSKAEFDDLPKWRQQLEKLYRSPMGFGPYYLVERWWKFKFLPNSRTRPLNKGRGWLDAVFVVTFFISLCICVVSLSTHTEHTTPFSALILAVVVPFIFWNYAMGLTIYQHHTHPRVRWYRNKLELENSGARNDELTVHVKYPRWYNVLTHNIMEHPAHHVEPRIPLYFLHLAEEELENVSGKQIIIEKFSFSYLLNTIRSCKLYDFENHNWLDFEGRRADRANSIRVKNGRFLLARR